jgi:hypothetical protein
VAEAVQEWIRAVGTKTAYIERRQSVVERLHRELQRASSQELLDGEIFRSLGADRR